MVVKRIKKKLVFLFGAKAKPYRTLDEQLKVDSQCKAIILYESTFCPYCLKVRRCIERLELKIEMRTIGEAKWADELVKYGGLFQVPCLRIQEKGQAVRWLYESEDIIGYLKQRFASHS